MSIKKTLALMLALLFTLTSCAFATAGGAAGEEVPEHNYEVITDPVIITFGDREIHVSEAMPRFNNYYQQLSGYQSYGIEASSFLSQIKKTVLSEMTQELIEEVKVEELKYNQFSEEEQAAIDAQVEETFNEVYLYYYDYFTYNSAPDADIDATVKECLEYYNYTKEDIYKMVSNRVAVDKMASDLTAGIVVTDEAMQSYYDALVAQDQTAYAENLVAYEEARMYGTDDRFMYNPEGYRRVLQVLIGFETEEDKTAYNDLLTKYNTLINGGELTVAEGEVAPTIDELKAAMTDMEAPLRKIAAEVTDKFNNGTPIDALMDEYSADRNTPAEGYYVNIQSSAFDSAFVDAAYSVSEIGELSAPYAGQHGLYMVYYLADVPAGPVALEDVRAELEPECLSNLQRDTYFAQLNLWRDQLGITTNIEMFITPYDN